MHAPALADLIAAADRLKARAARHGYTITPASIVSLLANIARRAGLEPDALSRRLTQSIGPDAARCPYTVTEWLVARDAERWREENPEETRAIEIQRTGGCRWAPIQVRGRTFARLDANLSRHALIRGEAKPGRVGEILDHARRACRAAVGPIEAAIVVGFRLAMRLDAERIRAVLGSSAVWCGMARPDGETLATYSRHNAF
ncbi:hypothetical protein E8L99_16585 [Phreatobacter aquaticus]|uniref:Uncharacterized protein n=1 Tax=Phreatobacter aquaticus TaxID=2570229 RepID=A0A4D7QNS6_9HYPH|nr:hypothetical protein [Phreatobacter aquaticus]QCK87259.1 hypothetical protein E8L99_16585 [Phreatobacter aquaticus]